MQPVAKVTPKLARPSDASSRLKHFDRRVIRVDDFRLQDREAKNLKGKVRLTSKDVNLSGLSFEAISFSSEDFF